MKINFFNINCFFTKHKIKKTFNYLLENLKIDSKKLVVNVGFVSDGAIQKLNQEHRQIDKVTDVLSFPFLNLEVGKWITSEIYEEEKYPQTGFVELGDIIICENVAKIQAEKYGHSLKREVCFLATHGFLHVLGFDHETSEEEENMNKLTQIALEKAGVRRWKVN